MNQSTSAVVSFSEHVLPFDRSDAVELNRARIAVLDEILTRIPSLAIRSALDTGTGAGYFAGHLRGRWKLRVTAMDVRVSNIEEARDRFPDVDFKIGDVENASVASLGEFDLVTSFGLFYHLENPFRVARNLAGMARHLLILESMVAPGAGPQALLVDEYRGDDQGVDYIGLQLTEAGLVKLLYKAGFEFVYRPRCEVNHQDFRSGILRRRMRVLLVGARAPLDAAFFRLLRQPRYQLDYSYYCRRSIRYLLRPVLEARRQSLASGTSRRQKS